MVEVTYPQRFRATPETTLADTIPIEERLARTPHSYTSKGLYFTRLQRMIGARFDPEALELIAPPRLGVYLPFHDYPQVDHARLAIAAARIEFADVPIREALRRLERSAATTFGDSALGRAINTLSSDPKRGLMLLPSVYSHIQSGGVLSAHEQAQGVRLEARGFAPWLDCRFLGGLEGAVVLFGARPVIDVEMLSETDANFDVRW